MYLYEIVTGKLLLEKKECVKIDFVSCIKNIKENKYHATTRAEFEASMQKIRPGFKLK